MRVYEILGAAKVISRDACWECELIIIAAFLCAAFSIARAFVVCLAEIIDKRREIIGLLERAYYRRIKPREYFLEQVFGEQREI
jgi:hypothetical protein